MMELVGADKTEIGTSPVIYKTIMKVADVKFHDQGADEKEEIMKFVQEKIVKKQVMAYLNTLPGVDSSPYIGDYLK